MISAIGVRNVVENQVDFTNSRNLIIAAVIPVSYTHLDVYKRQAGRRPIQRRAGSQGDSLNRKG